jgi:23S rRNA pseudouridine1911/1915/1917 synthase
MTRLLVWPRDEGLRLDQFLARLSSSSRRRMRGLIADGAVRVNDRPRRILSLRLEAGDVVDVLLTADGLGDLEAPAPPAVALLHEDRWLAVADKPAGVLSQPVAGRGDDALSLDQQLLLALAWREGRRPFLRLVHRLDRVTSGALLFARTREALPALSRAWREGVVGRRYLAVVEGHPDFTERALDDAIARDPGHEWRFRVSPAGKPARTLVSVVRRLDDGLALVSCTLTTGRTHQVRVHLAAAGHPVLGDRLYGSTRPTAAPRPLLHAATLDLPHPRTGERLHVEAPLPVDFARVVGDG